HRSPSEEGCNRIQIGTKAVTADTCSFKGNAPATAESIANAHPVSKLSEAELFNQLGKVGGCRSKMSVHLLPCLIGWPGKVLRAFAILQLLVVGESAGDQPLQHLSLRLPLCLELWLFFRARPSTPL